MAGNIRIQAADLQPEDRMLLSLAAEGAEHQ